MSVQLEEKPKVSNGDNDNPPMRHLARMSERRFDGTVDTFCGLRRTVKPPKPNAQKCQKCEEVMQMIRNLERL